MTTPRFLEAESVSLANLSREVQASVGRFLVAHSYPGPIGLVVDDDTAYGRKAVKASSSGPGGLMVEVS